MKLVPRIATASLLLAGLALSGCSSSPSPSGAGSSSSASSSTDSAATASPGSGTGAGASSAAAPVLEPLPAAIPDALQHYYTQKLSWHSCNSGFQCSTLKVPLDYAQPAAGDISLAVVRHQASGKGSTRLGSLLINPGGPGGSAVEYAEYAAMTYPAIVRSSYDIVGVDPRGVAGSTPVSCLSDKQMDAYTATDSTPDTPAEINTLVAADKALAQGCEKLSGKLLSHVSTVDSARDMDVVRALLGDAKLNYLGKSYGTFLGATYAGLFPSRVGRMVLDGAMNPSLDALDLNQQQAGGFETAFNAFAADCVKSSSCPLGSSTEQADRKLDQLLASWDAHPLSTGTSRKLDEALGTTGVIAAMYDQQQWPQLRGALTQAERGDGSGLLSLSDQYYERDSSGHYSNLMYANAAVNCLDLPTAATGPEQVEQQLAAYRKASPHFGTTLAWGGLTCAYWPVKPSGEARTIPAKGSAPIVVVGTTRDPATPYAWAQALAAQLDSGTLLTYNGDGHTAYARGSQCIDGAINVYLLTGRTPAKGTVCK
ncbi:alpha/beta hydrolase [Streptacidiphilus sp. N1-3]|uniref:Alpha/beta hydrolase n=1 Tax=Streptacidiphilus alkalitolerans TaxID=3342712 RepID=A0ABV6WY64_9ACTN